MERSRRRRRRRVPLHSCIAYVPPLWSMTFVLITIQPALVVHYIRYDAGYHLTFFGLNIRGHAHTHSLGITTLLWTTIHRRQSVLLYGLSAWWTVCSVVAFPASSNITCSNIYSTWAAEQGSTCEVEERFFHFLLLDCRYAWKLNRFNCATILYPQYNPFRHTPESMSPCPVSVCIVV